MGDEEGFQIHILVAAVMATCDLWAGALFCKSRTPRVSFPRLFLGIAASVCLHNMHCLLAALLKIMNHDYPLTILKHSSSLLNEPS